MSDEYEADIENSGTFDGEETGTQAETETFTMDEPAGDVVKPIPQHKPELPTKKVGIGHDTTAFTGTTSSAVRDGASKEERERRRAEHLAEHLAKRRSTVSVPPANTNSESADIKSEPAGVKDVVKPAVPAEMPVAKPVVDEVKVVAKPAITQEKPVETSVSPHDVAYDKVANPVDLAKMASRYGVKPDDPMWEAFLLVIEAQAARDTAIKALDTANKLLKDIPNQIEAKLVGQINGLADTLNTASQKVAIDRATDIQKLIDNSVASGVSQIDTVASNLSDKVSVALAKLDTTIKNKVDNGIELFANSAAEASVSAVKAASSRVMVRSYLGAVLIILFAGLAGFGGAEFDHYYTVHSQMVLSNSKAMLGGYAQRYMVPNKNG